MGIVPNRNAKNEKTGKSFDFPALVEQVLEISNGFIAGFKAVMAFNRDLPL